MKPYEEHTERIHCSFEDLMEEIAQGLLFIGNFVGSGYASQIDLS